MKALLLSVLASLAVSAAAQPGGPCMMTELQKLCGAPTSPAFNACAKEKSGEAMAACQGGGGPASGDSAPAKGGKQNPCKDDMQKYCPGKWPGTPEFHSCMNAHMSEVTPECAAFGRKQAAKHGADGKKMSAGDKACVADAKRLCPGLTGADGVKFMSCMSERYDKLSEPCRKVFKGAKEDQGGGATVSECAKAMAEKCPGVEPGGPGMLKCVTEHSDVGVTCGGKKKK